MDLMQQVKDLDWQDLDAWNDLEERPKLLNLLSDIFRVAASSNPAPALDAIEAIRKRAAKPSKMEREMDAAKAAERAKKIMKDHEL